MVRVSVTELRQHLAEYLERAQRGEVVEVTARGVPIARLTPPADALDAARARMEERRRHAHVGDVVSPVGDRWDALDDPA